LYDGRIKSPVNIFQKYSNLLVLPFFLSRLDFSVTMASKPIPAIFRTMITIDGKEKEIDTFSMNIGICQYNGGGMKQVPDAIPDDGIFDLTIIKKIGRFEVLRSIPRLYDGRIKSHRKVESYNGKKILIRSKGKVFLETDGENLGHTPFEFEILPRKLRVIRA
jgi:diacylglycerol kinase family enzyme